MDKPDTGLPDTEVDIVDNAVHAAGNTDRRAAQDIA